MSKAKAIVATVLLGTLLVACSADGLVPPTTAEVTISIEMPYPEDSKGNSINGAIPEVTVSCLSGCENGSDQTQVTDSSGRITFTGNIPMTIRAEKSGFISVEKLVYSDSSLKMGHQWPSEVEGVIHQLKLTNVLDGAEPLLIWGDEKYFSGPSHGGAYECPALVMVRKWRGHDFMINTLIHELMHVWQGRNHTKPPCYSNSDEWGQSEPGQAWIAATKKDLDPETGPGPIPDFDNKQRGDKSLWQVTTENMATFYADWYMGTLWFGRNPGTVTKDEFYRLAPHRSQYLEDNFSPPR